MGSLINGRRVLVVATASGTAVGAEPARANWICPAARSQLKTASGVAPGRPKLAVERPDTSAHDQVPGVCGASRQSAGGRGSGAGRGTGRGWLITTGGGTGLGAEAQALSTRVAMQQRGTIAFTPLLWKEPRQ